MAFPPDVGTSSVPFARHLAGYGQRVALVAPDAEISYLDLAARVDAARRRLGGGRRLVLLTGGNEVCSVVLYLAALAAGHPVLLAPDRPESLESLIAAYDPDVVAGGEGERWWIDERRAESAHGLHPDLALLLTTSGTTGSAKLVRLSHGNLQSNAESIATYLAIRPEDRAATTLPMHYCYGLSVLNSHLLRGASLILTGRSVTDPAFWQRFRDRRGTSIAGVPYTFDLLDRVGFGTMRLPHLRYVTQAGGRLAPERVLRYAELGRRNGWDFFVMYGQTEATARMGYLPPDLAASHPGCVGVPVPGGSFRLEPLSDWPEPDTGELIYRGPNVMLGYAETPTDLGQGRVVDELRTGDVARRTADGVYEIVGRRSRFVKLFGLRVDLHRVEEVLERHGLVGCCPGGDDGLVVAVEGTAESTDAGEVRRLVARECGLPVGTVRVSVLAALPRLASGKPDYPAVRALTGQDGPAGGGADRATHADPAIHADPAVHIDPATHGGGADRATQAGGANRATHANRAEGADRANHADHADRADHADHADRANHADQADQADLRTIYAEVLGRPDVTADSTFVGLGGDSLSYVELSVRLERVLGRLPDRWHTTPIRDLHPRRVPARWGRAILDTSVALRAVAIFLIVGTHASLFALAGGAHLLLGVAGFNFARFHLSAVDHRDRVRHIGRSIARVAVASMSWIALVVVFTDSYSLANVFLVNYLFGSEETRHGWHFWFLESLVYLQLAALLGLAVPAVDRLERRFPFGLPMALVALGLVTRYQLVPGVALATPLVVIWLFALGWAAAKASTRWQRLLVTFAILATLPGFFASLSRTAIVTVGLVLLVWVSRVPSLQPVNRLAALLAGASLFIYLTHWQVYPHLSGTSPLLAVAVSLVAGVAYAVLVTRAPARLWPPVRRVVRRVNGRTAVAPRLRRDRR